MSDTTTRTASPDDHGVIRDIAERSFTASYDLSPHDITELTEELFGDGFADTIESDDAVVSVAEREGEVVGFAEGFVEDPATTIEWLHVDPDHRGHGVGVTLFEDTVSTLRDRSDGHVRATVATSAREGSEFFERFEFEKTDERDREVGSLTVTEAIYTDPAEHDGDGQDDAPTADTTDAAGATGDTTTGESDVDFPDTVTDDGEEVHVGEEILSGTDGPFAQTYKSADREEQYSYYCGNCDSTDVALDSMDRLECNECGNVHKSTEGYDGAYL